MLSVRTTMDTQQRHCFLRTANKYIHNVYHDNQLQYFSPVVCTDTETDSSSSIPVGVIVAPIVFVLIGAVGTTIIALGIVLCRHKANLRMFSYNICPHISVVRTTFYIIVGKKPQRVDHNRYVML